MSPSQFQRVKCPSREHKPQFGLLSEKTLLLRRTRAWELRAAWEEPSWLSCKVRLHSSSLRGVARRRARSSWRL
ncbi:hypothetical protein Taro_021408 [Colocasia esculenta]|uniref:Uncharacterized protein n=1 Tax=Colocasia esculenta TaxID=4460 RepID=A0A843UYS7_COLES|nr:hypothetical protein [Colocasia esculenta]